jgi:hypothetical protein
MYRSTEKGLSDLRNSDVNVWRVLSLYPGRMTRKSVIPVPKGLDRVRLVLVKARIKRPEPFGTTISPDVALVEES